jgi:hypothetical protein
MTRLLAAILALAALSGCATKEGMSLPSSKPTQQDVSDFNRKRPAIPCRRDQRGRLCLQRLPVVRQQLANAAGRLHWQALHDVLQIGMWFMPIELGRVHEAHDCGGSFARA